MKNNKSTAINILIFLLILTIIAIMVMGMFICKLCNEKKLEEEKTTKLQAQVDSLNDTASNLQDKIDSISKIMTEDKSTDNKDEQQNTSVKINSLDGKYINNDELEAYIYNFSGNNVTAGALATYYGTYKINDDKVIITYTKAEDPEGKEMDEFPDGQTEELTILDENTLVSNNGTKYIKK